MQKWVVLRSVYLNDAILLVAAIIIIAYVAVGIKCQALPCREKVFVRCCQKWSDLFINQVVIKNLTASFRDGP